ncbi:MAG: HK97-gp10 family putative phage morphogenesis protein [Romboutsia timonensis]
MIEFDGLDEVLESIDNLGDLQHLQSALGRACAVVEASAKQKAPKDTGALARSITSEVNGTEGVVFTTSEYAPYVEYGTGLFAEESGRNTPWSYEDDKGEWHTTSGQKPQPFMRPALDENREMIIRILKEGIGK